MNPVWTRLSRWFQGQRPSCDEGQSEALRIAFKERYHHFRLLLNANNQALRKMADIEQALCGHRPFGMAFVRDRCTGVSVNVLRMIQGIGHLAPGKYDPLLPRFKVINEAISGALSIRNPPRGPTFVVSLDSIGTDSAGLVGQKMAMLGEIKNGLGLRVPEGFVITTYAYEQFFKENGLTDEINRLVQTADMADMEGFHALSGRIRKRVLQSPLPPALLEAIHDGLQRLAGGRTFAVRSSALGEDSDTGTFAGQFLSALNVRGEDLPDAYREVIASKYHLHPMIYRLQRGIRDEDVPMAVGCVEMIDAAAGGVLYTRSPVDVQEADAALISSVWGMPRTVVDGTGAADLFRVSRTAPHKVLQKQIRTKAIKYVRCDTDSGLCRESVPDETAQKPSIDDGQAAALTRIGLMLEAFDGHPQDMEWAIDAGGQICVLQCRPLQISGTRVRSAAQPVPPAGSRPVLAEGGVTASPGAACGQVFRVERQADALQFPKGAILLTRQALPTWAALLNRAAAVVTAQGGVAGHLATLAREFGIPALFSLDGALDRLRPGETVTVDADQRRIYTGCVPSVLGAAPKPTLPTIVGSPVHGLLEKAARWIVPLNLVEPEASDFAIDHCRTLHDMTRFIHEKSVMEMFSFGRDHQFPERSGKQLHHRVPMQWWVLNLDDGFKTEVTGKYVRLENIASVPMLAFWEGFAAVAWDGPPAMDRGGLLSVMFHSTLNPTLVTGVKVRAAEKNFFMISKHFCSLHSRLGYHFSTFETLVGERKRENYLCFQFKGGAADMHRRVGRTALIGDILEGYGFAVKRREDHLSARIQEESEKYMCRRLALLGYLTLHTRQLDMIMENEKQVAHYRAKLQRDIETHIL
jgi:pyruvate, water dikinase